MTPRKRSSRSTRSDEESAPPASVNLQTSEFPSQKIIFLNGALSSSSEVACVHLRHPRTSSRALFLLGTDEDKTTHLAELNTFDEGHRSWFVGDTVQSDGKLYIATHFNPIYLVLPYLINAERLVPLDQLLDDEEFPAMAGLASLAAPRLHHVADAKGSADLNVWKYNADKTLTWLANKCRQLFDCLMEKKVPTTTAQALTFVRTMDQQQTKDAYMVLAHGIISDYLPESLSLGLRERLCLPALPLKVTKKPPSSGDQQQPPTKKTKLEGPVDDYVQSAAAPKTASSAPNAKARALAKSAAGNKSITSFFSKK